MTRDRPTTVTNVDAPMTVSIRVSDSDLSAVAPHTGNCGYPVLQLDARGCHARCPVHYTSQRDGSQFRLRSHFSSPVPPTPEISTDGTNYGGVADGTLLCPTFASESVTVTSFVV